MERRKIENLTDVLHRFLRHEGLETPLNEYRAVDVWDEIVGPMVARCSKEKKIYNRKLFVKLTSPVIRQELQMKRSFLVKEINEKVGADVIEELVLT
jgi:predicted nucleic acid-binding Zn ribbon protein